MTVPAAVARTLTPPPADVGGSLVSVDGRSLPLRHSALEARAKGGVARTVVRQTFVNPHAEALEVSYQLPLPVDGAVSGFRFELDGVAVVGEVDRRHRARERYAQALVEGRTAALLEQERPNLFTQRVGNLPPRGTVVCEVTVDQRLTWLDEGAWEWRFPTVVAPRYLGEPGRVRDADALRVAVSDEPLGPRLALALTIADAIAAGGLPESPSHPTETALRDGVAAVSLRDGAPARLDRDVVVRWPVAAPAPGLSLDVTRAPDHAPDAGRTYGLLTIVPPSAEAPTEALPRDLIFLLDTSGSMGGRPLEQAARVVCAMIDTLTERDRLEVIEFSSEPRRWRPAAVPATAAHRAAAMAWVRGLAAGGSTEMRRALLDALRPLRGGAQRQVLLITDGYIGFEREIVETVYRALPRGCRLHTLGVGSSVNRALTGPAAQAGRGVEQVVGLDEDPERAARRLVARTRAPLVTELTVEGAAVVSPARLPDLFAGSPVLISLALDAPEATLRVRGQTARGEWAQTLRIPAADGDHGAARARFARDRVEDHELHLAAGGDPAELDRAIESVGVDFQIATRLTAWIAVSHSPTVDPQSLRRAVVQPQELPDGVSAEGLGLRAASGVHPLVAGGGALGFSDTESFASLPDLSLTTGSFAAAPPPTMAYDARAPLAPPPDASGSADGALPSAPYALRRRGWPWALVLALLVLVALIARVYRTTAKPTGAAGPRPAPLTPSAPAPAPHP